MATEKKILLVDDDALVRRSLTYSLEQAGYRVRSARTAEEAIEMAVQSPPDLMLLDIGLPGMDGLEALKKIRNQFNLPIIFLTARRRELDEILGLELGADDYITKPFDVDILLARIRSALRRQQRQESPPRDNAPITVGALTIDPAAYTVEVEGQSIELSPRTFNVLRVLAEHAGEVVTLDDLLLQVWGPEYAGESQVVYVQIRWLREKIEKDPNHPTRVVTVRGVGYKLLP